MLPEAAQAQLWDRVSTNAYTDQDLQQPVVDPTFQMMKLLCAPYLW